MLRFTSITPVYEKDGTIIEYHISVDNNTDNNSISANLTIQANEIDTSDILSVCKLKLQETVS